ncbi:uncharacterized protein LOC144175025 isoform X2 [Haemaphysalis longicornis]
MELRKSLRRKFTGNIRSPVVRRDSQAEVVIKGWLYKLEGATIKQWKKRWCILSEYCLFYYKGPEEEKCLGSILLPSYKIRPCTADDKVSLKHSFVAEHQNTKTYYFAAENNSGMCQWMNAMSLASLVQKDTDRTHQAMPPRGAPQPGSAQGFPPDYPFPQHAAPQRHHPQHHPQRPSDESFEVEAYSGAAAESSYLSSGEQYPCSYTRSPIYDQRLPPPAAPRQRPCHPVYANAPPKPLRHGAVSPNAADGAVSPSGAYDGYYEGYDFYGPQEPLPAYAGRPVSAHYGDHAASQLMRPRSADFLERDDDGGEDGELYFRKRSAPAVAAKPRPKSSMAHCDWEDEEDAREWRGHHEQGQQQQQWRSRTMETVAQGSTFHDQPRLAGALSAKTVAASEETAQSKKAAHKEQSMKRLLEWKQRMLQSPLCKKPGQQQQPKHPVPSSLELQSAVLRKTPAPESSSSSSMPPERPPLPEEYRRRASEGCPRPLDASPLRGAGAGGRFFAGGEHTRGTPVGRAVDPSTLQGPDLIQHAKVSPTRYNDSPDYVNLRNLRCDPEFFHEKQSAASYAPPAAQAQKPLRSCLSQSSGNARQSPSQRERRDSDWNQSPTRMAQPNAGFEGERMPNFHYRDAEKAAHSRDFSPSNRVYSGQESCRSPNDQFRDAQSTGHPHAFNRDGRGSSTEAKLQSPNNQHPEAQNTRRQHAFSPDGHGSSSEENSRSPNSRYPDAQDTSRPHTFSPDSRSYSSVEKSRSQNNQYPDAQGTSRPHAFSPDGHSYSNGEQSRSPNSQYQDTRDASHLQAFNKGGHGYSSEENSQSPSNQYRDAQGMGHSQVFSPDSRAHSNEGNGRLANNQYRDAQGMGHSQAFSPDGRAHSNEENGRLPNNQYREAQCANRPHAFSPNGQGHSSEENSRSPNKEYQDAQGHPRAFSPDGRGYPTENNNSQVYQEKDSSALYDSSYIRSDRQLSPTNILVQRGRQSAATSHAPANREWPQHTVNQWPEAREGSYTLPTSPSSRVQQREDDSVFLEEKGRPDGRAYGEAGGSRGGARGMPRQHSMRLSSSEERNSDHSNTFPRSDQGVRSPPRSASSQDKLYGNADMWRNREGSASSSLASRPAVKRSEEEAFCIKKEDYYRASQMFYPRQPASKTLLGSLSDSASTGSGPVDTETFDSRYRRSSTMVKSPQWELDKDVGLPLPDNLDLSFQSTSNNSVFEASCECQTPGDQSPELFQGTLRPNRTYVRDRQPPAGAAQMPKDSGQGEAKFDDSTEVKTPVGNSNFEEMRSVYQRKKEAPPTNIVQDRIKCFEPKADASSKPTDHDQESWEAGQKQQLGERYASTSGIGESQQDVELRATADAAKFDSLAKYGSTSILASLHRSAELMKDRDQLSKEEKLWQEPALKADTLSMLRHRPQQPPPSAALQKPPEAHYLPMGWLASEADYVSMNVDLSPGCSLDEEPVYNEPVLPGPSYAQDSYGKLSLTCQALKGEGSGSSSDGSTENIYEQVQQAPDGPRSKAYSSLTNDTSKLESPPVYEEPYGLMSSKCEAKVPEKPKSHELFLKDGSKQLVRKAIPDLLHHEEVKDSGASDADDEASRADFDTATSSLPSYQKEVLSDHISSLPLRLPTQPYLPVYSAHATKYSFKKDRKSEGTGSGVPSANSSLKEPEKSSLGPPSKFVSFAETAGPSSKLAPEAQPKVSSYQTEMRPTSIGLLKNLEGDTSSSEAGSSLASSVAKTSSADTALQGSSAQGSFNQVSSPLLSTAPDVLPSEVRSVVSESNSNKAQNSSSSAAPYYYSDIFGDKLGMIGSLAARPSSQQSRAAPNMLNNTRDVTSISPPSKDHVGRKVNKISTPAGLSISHTRTRSEPQSTADLESTLRGLLHPANTRKFSDAERNKYVAGHTLEKTSHMSRSVLCHMRSKQASETSQAKSEERAGASSGHDSEEQARSRSPGRMLQGRLSRSLEDIIDNPPADSHATRSKTPVIPCQDEPYYENVGFGSARAQSSPPKPLSGASPQVSPAKHSIYDGEDLCREFVAAGVLGDPAMQLSGRLLGHPVGQLTSEQRVRTPTADLLPVGSLSASLGSLKLSSPEHREPSFSSSSHNPHGDPGKRCWSNDFQKSSAQGDHYRHSVDNLHVREKDFVQPKNSPEKDPEPASPSTASLSHSISAGDLLGKSHEELVLLLIQLRRSQSNLLGCQVQVKEELHELKQQLVQSGAQSSATDVQRLVGLQRSLNELTRNLDLTHPLISLVENMVKLGSLYNIAGTNKQEKRLDEDEDYRYEDTYADTLEAETLEKQQQLIEKEILHIQSMLAESTSCGSPLKDDLEVELKRLQKIVNDLLQRRSKAGSTSAASIYLEDKPQSVAKSPESKTSPTGSLPERKRHQKTYYETDLDSSVTSNLALDSRPSSLCDVVTAMAGLESPSFSPEPNGEGVCGEDDGADRSYMAQDISTADDRTKKFYGLLPRDRAQEIKTVRIVKRESERRSKGKDRRSGGKGGPDDPSCPLAWVTEEADGVFHNDEEEEEEYEEGAEPRTTSDSGLSTFDSSYETKKVPQDSSSSEDRSASSSSSESTSGGQRTPVKNESRRNKRRHYTISGSHPFLEQHSPPKMPACLRSRDDMDMERCLRTVNTPDIVRSTIKKSDVYDEQTIDMQIGLPQKILIPERYIEVESENVSAVEQLRRSLKAANIRKMLTETVGYEDLGGRSSAEALRSKVGEEKRRRAHLLALSHTIAKEVMERSKMVAAHVTFQENS